MCFWNASRNFQLKDSRKDDVRINVLNHRYYFTKLFFSSIFKYLFRRRNFRVFIELTGVLKIGVVSVVYTNEARIFRDVAHGTVRFNPPGELFKPAQRNERVPGNLL